MHVIVPLSPLKGGLPEADIAVPELHEPIGGQPTGCLDGGQVTGMTGGVRGNTSDATSNRSGFATRTGNAMDR